MKIFFCVAACFYFGTINAQQNVGIGTSTPAASAQLHINSTTKGLLIPRLTTVQRVAIVSPANGLQVYDTNTNSFWYFNNTAWVEMTTGGSGSTSWATSGNNIFNNNSGAVGIGTSSPDAAAKATIQAPDQSIATVVRNASGSAIFQTYVGGASNGNVVSLGTPGDMPLALYTNSANRLFINSGGDIGIGTNNPGSKLEVIGNMGAAAPAMTTGGPFGFGGGILSLRNTSGVVQSLTLDGSSMQSTSFNGTNTTYEPVSINPYGGRVSIGTNNPHAASKATIQTADYSTALTIRNPGSSAVLQAFVGGPANGNTISLGTPGDMPLAFYTNSANRLFVTPAGNIGLGTEVPNSKLEVNGSLSMPIRTIAAAGYYNINDDDYTIIADVNNISNNSIDLFLPNPAGRKGRIYHIKAEGLPRNASTVVRIFLNSELQYTLGIHEVFGASPSVTTMESATSCTFQSNAAKWFIITSDYFYYVDYH